MPTPPWRFSIAPMMDWTDRHCRVFHRQFSQNMLLYTEMVTAAALVHGDHERLLHHTAQEHPLALQVGGSDPALLAQAVKLANPYGFEEINLNVGCPSDRVQSGRFGACLMAEPETVASCIKAMQDVANPITEITVKCRLGIDDQEPTETLPQFIDTVAKTGCTRFIVHARKAWLKGLSPKENRMIPPLDYNLVYASKAQRPDLTIILNGGLDSWTQIQEALTHLDGVMIGRDAYHRPANLLSDVDSALFNPQAGHKTPLAVAEALIPYIESQLDAGSRLHHITRHMFGLFAGQTGAKMWRQTLSAHRDSGVEAYKKAIDDVKRAQEIKKQ